MRRKMTARVREAPPPPPKKKHFITFKNDKTSLFELFIRRLITAGWREFGGWSREGIDEGVPHEDDKKLGRKWSL